MKFEIAPAEYQLSITWDDARLYCLMLSIPEKPGVGWRIPTIGEMIRIRDHYGMRSGGYYWCMRLGFPEVMYMQDGSISSFKFGECRICPVRDL